MYKNCQAENGGFRICWLNFQTLTVWVAGWKWEFLGKPCSELLLFRKKKAVAAGWKWIFGALQVWVVLLLFYTDAWKRYQSQCVFLQVGMHKSFFVPKGVTHLSKSNVKNWDVGRWTKTSKWARLGPFISDFGPINVTNGTIHPAVCQEDWSSRESVLNGFWKAKRPCKQHLSSANKLFNPVTSQCPFHRYQKTRQWRELRGAQWIFCLTQLLQDFR